jgi:hypothetical protein
MITPRGEDIGVMTRNVMRCSYEYDRVLPEKQGGQVFFEHAYPPGLLRAQVYSSHTLMPDVSGTRNLLVVQWQYQTSGPTQREHAGTSQ